MLGVVRWCVRLCGRTLWGALIAADVPGLTHGAGRPARNRLARREITADEARLSFELVTRNVGRTPARGVNLSPKLHIDFRVPAGQAQRESARLYDERPLEMGQTVFPNQPHTFRHSIGVGRAEWEQLFKELDEAFPGTPGIEISRMTTKRARLRPRSVIRVFITSAACDAVAL